MAKTPLFFALLLNLYCLQTISAQSLPTSKFECYQFPESKPSSKISFDSDVFNTKTTYLKAWQFIRERNPNSTYYIDSNSCTPIYVFFIGRHSIRFPMKKEIVKFNEALPRLREELLRGGRLDRLVEADLLSWKLFINLADSARVTLSGQLDTSLQARHFYERFPSLLDIEKSNIEVGVTSKIRSKETAQAFIRAISELKLREKLPYDEANIAVEKFLKEKITMPVKDSTIMSHQRCKKHRSPERKVNEKKVFTVLSKSAPIQSMVTQFYKRNGLHLNNTKAAFENMHTMYQICGNELAILQHSPWCALFTLDELKVLSYMGDTYEYQSSRNADNGVACTIMKDLVAHLDEVVGRSKGGPRKEPVKSTLYFSHKGMISRLVQHLGLFGHFPSHYLDTSGQKLCVPADREFHSSTVLPFGANFAAVLHQCNGGKQLKLLTLYNEVPVTITGCSSPFCDLHEFMKVYGSASCKVDEICPL